MELFVQMYAENGRCGRLSMAPEKQLHGILSRLFRSIRPEPNLRGVTIYNLLYCCSIGLVMRVDKVITENLKLLIERYEAVTLFNCNFEQADKKHWLSNELASLTGPLIQVRGSDNSFLHDNGKSSGSVDNSPRKALNQFIAASCCRLDSKGQRIGEIWVINHLKRHLVGGNAMVLKVKRELVKPKVVHAVMQLKHEGEINQFAKKGFDLAEIVLHHQDEIVTSHVVRSKPNRTLDVMVEIVPERNSKRMFLNECLGLNKFNAAIRQVGVWGTAKIGYIYRIAMRAWRNIAIRPVMGLGIKMENIKQTAIEIGTGWKWKNESLVACDREEWNLPTAVKSRELGIFVDYKCSALINSLYV